MIKIIPLFYYYYFFLVELEGKNRCYFLLEGR